MIATERDRYDALVAEAAAGSVFARSWWLDTVAPGAWRPHVVVEHGRAVAAWPTVVRRTRWGDVHAGAPLTPYLGPIMLTAGDSVRRRAEEIRLLEQLLERIGPAAAIDAMCNPAFDYWTPLRWHGFTQTTRYTWRLDDLTDTDALFTRVRENVRREVRKSRKRGVEVGPGSLEELLDVHSRTAAQQGIAEAERSQAALRRLQPAAVAHDAGTILIARDSEGRVHAGAFFVHDRRFTYYLVGGSDARMRTSGAMSAVIWAGIERAAARGTGFDFEGSTLRSVERYFRAFAGAPAPYSRVHRTGSPAYAAEVAVKRMLARALRRSAERTRVWRKRVRSRHGDPLGTQGGRCR
jgi:Acetyltransferase (GNAT) domain